MAAEPAHLRLVSGREDPARPWPVARGPIAELSDAQLVALTGEDDAAAFEALYRRHAPFGLNLAVRLQGNSTDVEDVVHDAFLRAHARLDSLREPGAFRAWLGSIIVRLV